MPALPAGGQPCVVLVQPRVHPLPFLFCQGPGAFQRRQGIQKIRHAVKVYDAASVAFRPVSGADLGVFQVGLHAGCRSNEPGSQPFPGTGSGSRVPVEFILASQAANRTDKSGHLAAVVHAAELLVLFAVNGLVGAFRIGGVRPVVEGIADIFISLRLFSEQAFFLSKGDDGSIQRAAMRRGKEQGR